MIERDVSQIAFKSGLLRRAKMHNRPLTIFVMLILSLLCVKPSYAEKFDMSDERTVIKPISHAQSIHRLLLSYLQQLTSTPPAYVMSDGEAKRRAFRLIEKVNDIRGLLQVALFSQKQIHLYPDDSDRNRKVWTALKFAAISKVGRDYEGINTLQMRNQGTTWPYLKTKRRQSVSVVSQQEAASQMIAAFLEQISLKSTIRTKKFSHSLHKQNDSRVLADVACELYYLSQLWNSLPEASVLYSAVYDCLLRIDELQEPDRKEALHYLQHVLCGAATSTDIATLLLPRKRRTVAPLTNRY